MLSNDLKALKNFCIRETRSKSIISIRKGTDRLVISTEKKGGTRIMCNLHICDGITNAGMYM